MGIENGLPIEAETNRTVAHARPGHSMHRFGLAFDVVPLDAWKSIRNVCDPVWERAGRTGKECGLEWTGKCEKFREYAQFQHTGGIGLAEISVLMGTLVNKLKKSICQIETSRLDF